MHFALAVLKIANREIAKVDRELRRRGKAASHVKSPLRSYNCPLMRHRRSHCENRNAVRRILDGRE